MHSRAIDGIRHFEPLIFHLWVRHNHIEAASSTHSSLYILYLRFQVSLLTVSAFSSPWLPSIVCFGLNYHETRVGQGNPSSKFLTEECKEVYFLVPWSSWEYLHVRYALLFNSHTVLLLWPLDEDTTSEKRLQSSLTTEERLDTITTISVGHVRLCKATHLFSEGFFHTAIFNFLIALSHACSTFLHWNEPGH